MTGNALMEDIPRRQAEARRHEHADAKAEQRQPGDASSEALRGSIREQGVQHEATLPTTASHPPGTDCTMMLSTRCASCGCAGEALCHRCRFSLASVGSLRSPEGIHAAFSFEGVARDLIVALKFRHRRSAAGVLAAHRLPAPDAVISGIPFSTMPPEVADRIAAAIARVLAPGGRFVAYQVRAHVARYTTPYLGAPQQQWEWINLPPVRVFTWARGAAPRA